MEQGWKLQLTTTIIPENIPTQTMEQHLKFTWSLQSSTLIIRMKETTPVLLIRFRNVLVIAFYFRSKNCRKVWNRYVQRLSLGHFSLIRGTFIIYMGKSGDCGWKIKWFAPFRLEASKIVTVIWGDAIFLLFFVCSADLDIHCSGSFSCHVKFKFRLGWLW